MHVDSPRTQRYDRYYENLEAFRDLVERQGHEDEFVGAMREAIQLYAITRYKLAYDSSTGEYRKATNEDRKIAAVGTRQGTGKGKPGDRRKRGNAKRDDRQSRSSSASFSGRKNKR